MDLESLQARIEAFADERDWSQFHTPRNLVLALLGEMGELAEIFQWAHDSEISESWIQEHRDELSDELADVFIYLVRLSQILGVDLADAAMAKIERNESRYPADLARGNAKKYTQLGD